MPKKLCLVIGDPVRQSVGPKVYNQTYKYLGIENEFHYRAKLIKKTELAEFMRQIRSENIRGVSCTIPHKVAVMDYLDKVDKTAQDIGAVNTVVNKNGKLYGYNTDYSGILQPLEKIIKLQGQNVAVLGAGGAARAAVYAAGKAGAEVTIYNRTYEKAAVLASEFRAHAKTFEEINSIVSAKVIINATSVGLHPNISETPLPARLIQPDHIVFDVIYNPLQTRLLLEAEIKGAQTIRGSEMWLHQAAEQFRLYTKREAPQEFMRAAFLEAIK